MSRDELIARVALRMDEVSPDSGLDIMVDGRDNNPLYSLIDGIADDCALEIYANAPYWRLPQTAFGTASILVEALSSGASSRKIIRLKLPDNFLRVAEINCIDFQRPITEVVSEMSTDGRRQHNRFLMGREAKPVAVLSFGKWANQQCREIDCYSLKSTTTVTSSNGIDASYITVPPLAENVADTLQPALQWLIASRAFGARGDANHSAICQQYAQGLLV